MRYQDFRAKTEEFPIFNSKLYKSLTDNEATLRRQISEWLQRGYIIPLKRGVYTLRDKDRVANFSRYFLANQLYWPSFISLETALSYYDLIPERVEVISSVSPKKTQQFTNQYGQFMYHHIKPSAYNHFVAKQDEFNNKFYIATPERALLDYLYFKTAGLKVVEPDWFAEALRLQNTEILNKKTLAKIASCYGQKKLLSMTKLLVTYLE